MFDLQRTIELMKGMVVEPRPTWEAYYLESSDLQRTLGLLTIPGIVIAALLNWVLSLLFSPFYMFGGLGVGLSTNIFTAVVIAVAIAVNTFLVTYLAGVFKGERDYPRGLAALSLAYVPSWLGWILAAVPFVGGLIALVLALYSVVLLYKMIPLYLKVPQSARAGHFVSTIIAGMVVWAVLMMTVGRSMVGGM
jgi:hypothetical protein